MQPFAFILSFNYTKILIYTVVSCDSCVYADICGPMSYSIGKAYYSRTAAMVRSTYRIYILTYYVLVVEPHEISNKQYAGWTFWTMRVLCIQSETHYYTSFCVHWMLYSNIIHGYCVYGMHAYRNVAYTSNHFCDRPKNYNTTHNVHTDHPPWKCWVCPFSSVRVTRRHSNRLCAGAATTPDRTKKKNNTDDDNVDDEEENPKISKFDEK